MRVLGIFVGFGRCACGYEWQVWRFYGRVVTCVEGGWAWRLRGRLSFNIAPHGSY